MSRVKPATGPLAHHAGPMDAPVDSLALASALYPALAGLLPAAVARGEIGPPLAVAAGTVLFDDQQPCTGFPLLLAGEVAVSRRSSDGRSLELYRVGAGELCLVSSACLFQARPMSAQGVAVRPTTLLLVPPALFHAWLAEPAFRDLVLGLYAERMADLTALVDAIAFQRLDQRLAAALLGHGPELAITHHELAASLGTVREIVSRLLGRFERAGWIEAGRERIRLRDVAALRRCAEGGLRPDAPAPSAGA